MSMLPRAAIVHAKLTDDEAGILERIMKRRDWRVSDVIRAAIVHANGHVDSLVVPPKKPKKRNRQAA
jgi:hypothetical protein